MPSRESIAPERLARNDRASLAGGGGVAGTCCCALGRAVRKSGERGGVGAPEARRGSSMDSLRPFLGGSPSRSRNEPPRMQRTRGARVESGGGETEDDFSGWEASAAWLLVVLTKRFSSHDFLHQ